LITQTYDAYHKYGLNGVADILGTEVAQSALSDIQTELAWYTIAKFIPPTVQEDGKKILSAVMEKVTSAEISFCKKILLEEYANNSNLRTSRSNYIARPRQNNYCSKIPEDVNRV